MVTKKNKRRKLLVLVLCILLTVMGCGGQENKGKQESVSPQQETDKFVAKEADLQQTKRPIVDEEKTEEIPDIFIKMFENHPLYRRGILSPDNRYYAYQERSSVILVQLPTTEEYLADNTLVPKVMFVQGIRAYSTFDDLEADYARRLKQPLLTEEELDNARKKLRSVYNWDCFYYLKFSQDGRYLAYLGESGFGRDRKCTVHVLDLEDDYEQYDLFVEENSEYAGITWQEDNQTLDLDLPWAETIKGGFLAMRRSWHIPSNQINMKYYNSDDDSDDRQEITLADAKKAIKEYTQEEEERNQAAEELAQLTVEQRVTALTAEELAEEYARYYSLHDEQRKLLKERGYSDEAIAKMDSMDFKKEEEGWLLSEERIGHVKSIYPQLENEDLSQWTNKDFEEYSIAQTNANNAPSEEVKQEILERGLPEDIPWRVEKEFYGWENMLTYTNEAIMAMYDAVRETDTIFGKEEEYRLAVRAAYLKK